MKELNCYALHAGYFAWWLYFEDMISQNHWTNNLLFKKSRIAGDIYTEELVSQ